MDARTPLPSAPVKGRFAPTPSGRMHLGNVLCSLLAWLAARASGGTMVLRIEDLDAQRCPQPYAEQLEDDLRWLGLDWEEGGLSGGEHAPYRQSLRSGIYESYYEKLQAMGLVYPCFCSRVELHAASAPHAQDGTFVYSGRCRQLSGREIREKSRLRAPAMRLRVPDEEICFTDLRCGEYRENLLRDCGDFVVRRYDGVFAYQLAVVIDDALMGVTQVVRGSDLLPSSARQTYLYRLFGWEPPVFGHIPLLFAPDGRRLSKRDGDLDLGALREHLTAQELIGQLAALCGLTDTPEPVQARELIGLFSWDKLPKGDIMLPQGFLYACCAG